MVPPMMAYRRSSIRVAAWAIRVVAVVLSVAACGRGFETVVVNNASAPFIVEAVDPSYEGFVRYYAVTPGAIVRVDTVEDLNGIEGLNEAIDSVTLFDVDCKEVGSVEGDFSNGGVITIDSDGGPSFEASRASGWNLFEMRGPNQFEGSEETCEGAAGKLVGEESGQDGHPRARTRVSTVSRCRSDGCLNGNSSARWRPPDRGRPDGSCCPATGRAGRPQPGTRAGMVAWGSAFGLPLRGSTPQLLGVHEAGSTPLLEGRQVPRRPRTCSLRSVAGIHLSRDDD
jgi:hypothetical protein